MKTKNELENNRDFERFYSGSDDFDQDVKYIIKEQKFDDLLLDITNFINLILSNRKDIVVFISTFYIVFSTFRKLSRNFALVKISLKFSEVFTLGEEFTKNRVSSRLVLALMRYFSILSFLVFTFFTLKNNENLPSIKNPLQERNCKLLEEFEALIDEKIEIVNVTKKFKDFLENEGDIDVKEMRSYLKKRFQKIEILKEKKRVEENLKKIEAEKKEKEEQSKRKANKTESKKRKKKKEK